MNISDLQTLLSPVRAIDLFCGIGGNSWGARDAGVQIVAGFDLWKLAGDVFKDNFSDSIFFPGRLQDINPCNIKSQLGNIDLILASPECTSHSVARGNREKSLESLNLAYQVLRFADELKPRWIIIENVRNMKKWEDYSNFLNKIKENYFFLEQSLIASDFGVPQNRQRLFIICDRKKQPLPIKSADTISKNFASQIISLNGTYNFSQLETKKRAKATLERAHRAFKKLGRKKSFLLVYYGSDAAGGWQRLDVPLRTITTIDRFALVKPKETGRGHLMRMLQPAELQAAMGFPQEFSLIHGTRRDKIHLLGNAVCPPVMKAIVQSLIKEQEENISNELDKIQSG
jgi:DNA (cytosine-5)-methyltransferase 1